MLYAKFAWNWLSGSGEEDFQNNSMDFRYFVIISPTKIEDVVHHFNKHQILSTKDALCLVETGLYSGSGEVENVRSLQIDRQTTDDRR